ncbi:MAG: hypothetical protein JNL05_00490 [Flavobacteriales bacterium]|nr:hypothetical protein [Flavobacteriales bacterium]
MRTAIAALISLWQSAPRDLRRALLYVAVAAAVPAGCVIAVQFWASGYIQERLDLVGTKADMTAQIDDLKAETAQHTALVVNTALANYTDSLKAVRSAAEDTILRPMLQTLVDLNRRVARVERMQGLTNASINALHTDATAQLERLAAQQSNASAEQNVLQALERLNTRLDAIEGTQAEIQQRLNRTNKQKF